MPSAGTPLDWTQVDIAVPRRTHLPPGIGMAGFHQRTRSRVEIPMVVHPSITVLVDLSTSGGICYDADGRLVRGSFVAGLLPERLRVVGIGGECLQIRLSPLAANAVFGSSADLFGTTVPLEAVLGGGAERLEERLRAATTWDQRFAMTIGLLRRRIRARPTDDMQAGHIWQRTIRTSGRVRVEDLAHEIGWSRKLLWSRFRSRFGITPKRAARLARFGHAAHLLAAGHPPTLVAAMCGYADQSHLHREVREFAGVTPATVAAVSWLADQEGAQPQQPTGISAGTPICSCGDDC